LAGAHSIDRTELVGAFFQQDRVSNDDYATLARKRTAASSHHLCAAGHINGDAGYGAWPEGERMLLDFCAQLKRA
jgi:predicted alpha/beta hydrolase family esterase